MDIVFNDFSGGLNNTLRPHKLAKNQAQLFDNVDNTKGTLLPLNRDLKIGASEPYQLVHFNQLIGTTQKITDMDTMVSQWGKYYTKDKIYYVNDDNTISSAYYGIGAPEAAEFTTSVNEVNFDNAKDLKGITYGLTEDTDGTIISDLLIDGITKEPIDIYKAWESDAIVVYDLDENGIELTGNVKEVLHSKMPYVIGTQKYAYTNSDKNDDYALANFNYELKLHYEPIMYSVIYTQNGVRQDVSWIDSSGNPINIHRAILTNAIIVINADENGIVTGYARGNIVENIPFTINGIQYTMSQTAPTGYTIADTTEWKTFVKYDDTDYDATDFHTYAITFYNSKTGQETPPIYGTTTEVHPAELGTSFRFVSNPDIDNVYEDFTKARIYRVSGPYKTFRFAKEVDISKSGDSLVIDFTENIPNADLDYICPTTDFVAKPQMEGITLHANRIFGYVGNTIYFTLSDNPYSWSEFATIFVEGAIKAIQTTSTGLLILTSSYKAYVITGTNINTFVLRKIADNIGYDEGMIGVKGNAYWIYNNDVYVSNGSQISNLSEDKFELPNESILDINVLDEDIYLVYTNFIYKIHNGSLIKLDRPNITDTVVYNGELRYFSDGYEYSLNSSTLQDTFEYMSPDIYVTTISEVKEFTEVKVVSIGEVTVKIFIDDNLVVETLLSSDGINTNTLKIPVSDNKGHLIKVNFKGTGEIYEYIVTTVGVTNGS